MSDPNDREKIARDDVLIDKDREIIDQLHRHDRLYDNHDSDYNHDSGFEDDKLLDQQLPDETGHPLFDQS
jgi:hypothetical protein